MKLYISYILLFCSIFSPYVLSGTVDPRFKDEKYIELANDYESVGILQGSYRDGSYFISSAVAVNSTTILTAAHVVENYKSCKFIIDGKDYKITNIEIHKKFNSDFASGDIAICFLDQDLHIVNYPELYSDNDEKDKLCVIVGYGSTGTLKTGVTNQETKKRAGFNIIENIYEDKLICVATDDLDMEFLIASGDSGGGLFIENKLAGINSSVMATDGNPDSSYTDESNHTRISIYKNWIQSKIKERTKKD